MSQLSTNTTNEKESMIKDIKAEIEKIPDYLTKRNQSFQQMLSSSTINYNIQQHH